MQYMLMRLGTIAGYEHILCSQVYLGVLGSWMLSRIWSRLRFFAGNESSLDWFLAFASHLGNNKLGT